MSIEPEACGTHFEFPLFEKTKTVPNRLLPAEQTRLTLATVDLLARIFDVKWRFRRLHPP
jgi:hypothetical protein